MSELEDRDPVVAGALQTLVPPPHGYGFWQELEAILAAGPADATVAVPAVAATAVIAAGEEVPPPLPPPPPLAEVVPLPPRRPQPRWWPLAWVAAAVLVVAAGALVVRSTSTDVTTTPAASTAPADTSLPPETTPAPSTTLMSPSPTSAPVTAPVTTAKPPAPTTTVKPATTTTVNPALVVSPSGLGGLRFGMTTDEAVATGVVGPYQDADPSTPGRCGYAKPDGTYRAGDFEAMFFNGRLVGLFMTSTTRLRTPEGAGIGSTLAALRAIPGTRMERPHEFQVGTTVRIMQGDLGYQFQLVPDTVTMWGVGTLESLYSDEGCA